MNSRDCKDQVKKRTRPGQDIIKMKKGDWNSLESIFSTVAF